MSKPQNLETFIQPEREANLVALSDLFELGALTDVATEHSFIRRLNTVMARSRSDMEKNIPARLADAINSRGVLKKHAELVVFGTWLINGSPGAKPRPGRQPDRKRILKCVAVIMAEIKLADNNPAHSIGQRGSRNRDIIKHDLARQWARLFDEKIRPSSFDAPLRSTMLVLTDYVSHLQSGSEYHSGRKIKKSPEITRALDAITELINCQARDPD